MSGNKLVFKPLWRYGITIKMKPSPESVKFMASQLSEKDKKELIQKLTDNQK